MHQQRLFNPERFAAFLTFHRANPHVYRTFLELTRRAHGAGVRTGARCVWENMRWRLMVETKADDGFVLNDHHVPYYSRLVMLRHPELNGFFERRDARFDVDDATLLKEAN